MLPVLVGAPDRAAISGITGSISIACWVIVFTPQMYENFRRQSSDGLSLSFIVLWLLGDIFNVIGALLQDLLPTMIILAIYYTLADIVLLLQCIVYTRRQQSLSSLTSVSGPTASLPRAKPDASHLNPATPLLYSSDAASSSYSTLASSALDADAESNAESQPQSSASARSRAKRPSDSHSDRPSSMSGYVWNTLVVMMVVFSGVAGWVLTKNNSRPAPADPDAGLQFNLVGQIFGWLCAVLYLGSRVPQIMLNFDRKSCDGISFLFFLFACLGNLTYVVSILANGLTRKYLMINASWLVGSVGTLALDFVIFCQFWLYGSDSASDYGSDSDSD